MNVQCLIASGVNADGCREILGVDVTSSEGGAGRLAFLRVLATRGLSGVALVTSGAGQRNPPAPMGQDEISEAKFSVEEIPASMEVRGLEVAGRGAGVRLGWTCGSGF